MKSKVKGLSGLISILLLLMLTTAVSSQERLKSPAETKISAGGMSVRVADSSPFTTGIESYSADVEKTTAALSPIITGCQ